MRIRVSFYVLSLAICIVLIVSVSWIIFRPKSSKTKEQLSALKDTINYSTQNNTVTSNTKLKIEKIILERGDIFYRVTGSVSDMLTFDQNGRLTGYFVIDGDSSAKPIPLLLLKKGAAMQISKATVSSDKTEYKSSYESMETIVKLIKPGEKIRLDIGFTGDLVQNKTIIDKYDEVIEKSVIPDNLYFSPTTIIYY